MAPNNQQPTSDRQPPTPELMAPAGDWTMLTTAVQNGADAIYFGVDKLNMRAKASNFSISELPEVTAFCKEHKVRTYLTLNSIVFEEELPEVDEILSKAKEAGVDRVICWDLAVAEKCKEHKIDFCISTQASVSNSISAQFYKKLGAKRVVFARECSLDEIKLIKSKTDLEVEVFVHGAMCIAVSGRCFMSHHLFDKSANRGECVQPCRREYEVYDTSIKKSLLLGEDYVLSPNDLCTIEFIDELIEAGIDSFKIEGRKRSPEYVAKTVAIYRKAIDDYFKKELTAERKKEYLEELESVYNRGFSSGFYFGKPSSDDYADVHGSKATTRKEYLGKVKNYFKKSGIAHILIKTGTLNLNDKIYVIGQTTGVVELQIDQMLKEETEVESAIEGDEVTFKCEELIRPRDAVYLIKQVD